MNQTPTIYLIPGLMNQAPTIHSIPGLMNQTPTIFLPGMGDCIWIAGLDAGQWFLSRCWLTRRATVFDLFTMIIGNFGYWLFPEWIIFILAYFKNSIRTSSHALTAAIAFVSVNNDEIFA
jgi:hypothetical protein